MSDLIEHLPGERGLQTRLRKLCRVFARWFIFYCGVAIVLCGCADRLILFPSRQPIGHVTARPLVVPGPVGKLEIWTMPSVGAATREPKAFVLAFVGNASRAEIDAEAVASQWGDLPVQVWAVNYPGYGQSEGSAKLGSIAPAALAAFDALQKRAAGQPIFVAGRSIGTAAALHVAAHRPVAGVILHSPPPLRALIMGRFGWWNLWLAAIPVSLGVPSDLDSIANARRVSAPGIFIVTGADALVPPGYQQRVIDAYAGPREVIVMPGVDHNDAIPLAARETLRASLGRLMNGRVNSKTSL